MKELLFIKPIFKEATQGGNRLKEVYNYNIPNDHTGECWAISTHRSGGCKVASGTYVRRTLSSFWREQGKLFGKATDSCKELPLLVKIIDAKEDLSIQVRLDNTYAAEHKNGSLGKVECWYILDYDEDGTIAIGHHIEDRKELAQVIGEGKRNKFIRQVPVKKGDFFQIDPGCVYATEGGMLILETQQSSDIAYRIYDYDGLSNGKPRQLHVKQSIDVIRAPFVENRDQQLVLTTDTDNGKEHHLVICAYYAVDRVEMTGHREGDFGSSSANVSILRGEDMADGIAIVKGSHFIVPAGYGIVEFKGRITFISSQAVQEIVTKIGRQVAFLDKV